MFTGLIEEIGTVSSIKYSHTDGYINIKANIVLSDTVIGDSIAVNGVCLTVTHIGDSSFTAYVMGETMRRSNLKFLKTNSKVNLERAVLPSTRLGGHIVSGHVDCCGKITDIRKESLGTWIKIRPTGNIIKYIAEKGSVAVDGTSLTAAYVTNEDFSVCLIPHTASQTTLTNKSISDEVNIEADILAKYTERLLFMKDDETNKNIEKSNITTEFLSQNGFL